MHACVFIIHNIHSTHTYICTQKLLFCMRLITIYRSPALIYIYIKPKISKHYIVATKSGMIISVSNNITIKFRCEHFIVFCILLKQFYKQNKNS